MKKIKSFIVIALLATLAVPASAQSRQGLSISITPAPGVTHFPSEVLEYYNNPMDYFRVTILNSTLESHEVYLGVRFSTTIQLEGSAVEIYSSDEPSAVHNFITLAAGNNKVLTRDDFDEHFAGRMHSNVSVASLDNALNMIRLPECTNNITITLYEKTTGELLSSSTFPFTVCYSGNAPEFTAPMLDNSFGTPVLRVQRYINFSWTGVISNCYAPTNFNYTLSFVEVYPNQNIQQAIDNNASLYDFDCGNTTQLSIDLLTDNRITFEEGHYYAATIKAEPLGTEFVNLSNNGYGQYMYFEFREQQTGNFDPLGEGQSMGGGITNRGDNIGQRDDETPAESAGAAGGQGGKTTVVKDKADKLNVSGNKKQVEVRMKSNKTLRNIKEPKMLAPTAKKVSTLDDITVSWSPIQGKTVSNVTYDVQIFRYAGSEVEDYAKSSPIKNKKVTGTTTVTFTEDELKNILLPGDRYMIMVSTQADCEHIREYRITEIYYVNGFPETHRRDSVSKYQQVNYRTGKVLQWSDK